MLAYRNPSNEDSDNIFRYTLKLNAYLTFNTITLGKLDVSSGNSQSFHTEIRDVVENAKGQRLSALPILITTICSYIFIKVL